MSVGQVVGHTHGEQVISCGPCATPTCANQTYVLAAQYKHLTETGAVFYCPAGHGQSFTPRQKIDEQKRRLREAEEAADRERERRLAAELAAERLGRMCPWPSCEGRLLASPKGLRQHMVKAHGAPWAIPEIPADEIAQVLNGRDPATVVR